jgi:hypothetical protein
MIFKPSKIFFRILSAGILDAFSETTSQKVNEVLTTMMEGIDSKLVIK